MLISCSGNAARPGARVRDGAKAGDVNLWRPLTIDPIMISSERRSLSPAPLPPAIGEEKFLGFSGDVSFPYFHERCVAIAVNVFDGEGIFAVNAI